MFIDARTKRSVVESFDSFPPSGAYHAVHIVMERNTGKTMDAFIEFSRASEAAWVVNQTQKRILQGRHPRVGTQQIDTTKPTASLAAMDESKLNKLPREIRDYIWELALIVAEPIKVTFTHTSYTTVTMLETSVTVVKVGPSQAITALTGLSATCQQAREEARFIFFVCNFVASGLQTPPARSWRLPPVRMASARHSSHPSPTSSGTATCVTANHTGSTEKGRPAGCATAKNSRPHHTEPCHFAVATAGVVRINNIRTTRHAQRSPLSSGATRESSASRMARPTTLCTPPARTETLSSRAMHRKRGAPPFVPWQSAWPLSSIWAVNQYQKRIVRGRRPRVGDGQHQLTAQ